MRAARRSEAGFTLVEMLVVLAVLAVVAGASSLSLSRGREGRALARTAERLAADLDRTRIDAIRSGRMRSLVFETEKRRWRRETAAPVALPAGVTLALTTAREAAAPGAGAAVAFLPNGRSSGGRIDLSAGEARRSLVVDWLTGAVGEAPP